MRCSTPLQVFDAVIELGPHDTPQTLRRMLDDGYRQRLAGFVDEYNEAAKSLGAVPSELPRGFLLTNLRHTPMLDGVPLRQQGVGDGDTLRALPLSASQCDDAFRDSTRW
mmetsp:Transcript_4376/g.9526  ORF Transcript_4376/g.9526 Transcript_4376/m.9526 type:complete len:110 (-) Transcript_4376:40-369(-)